MSAADRSTAMGSVVAPRPAPPPREKKRRPWLGAFIGLALGFGAAAALATFLEPPGAWIVPLPDWLATRLPIAGKREAVLAHPEALWLLPTAVLPFLVIVLRTTLVDAPRFQIALQLLARLAVVAAVSLALAQPTLESPIRGKTVVFVVDTSDSIDEGQLGEASALALEALQHIQQEEADEVDREDRTRFAMVTYGSRSHVVTPTTEGELDEALARREDEGLASDHAGALRLAAALVDPQTEGRVVFVSDGAGSLAEREDLAAAARELTARGITLHTRSFTPSARGDILVAGVHLPDELRVGQTFDLAVDLVASSPGKVTVEVTKNGEPNELEATREVELRGGTQQIKVPARVTEAGPVVFAARLDTQGIPESENRSTGNDEAAAVGDVRGRPKILLAGDGGGSPLARALRADHLAVESAPIPDTAEGMRAYDLVMFSDLPAGRVSAAQRQALASYVQDHGGGFIMVGGENSFGVGGWGGTTVERLLPVSFEGERQREQPKLALVLVIDKSGSMSSEDKLDLVKEASRATARTLDPSDEIGVIAFDSRPHVLVRLQPASNRIRISADIRRLTSGGGTNALPALREAYLQLAGSNALVKHVILLSDGQSPETGINALLGDMRDADLTVSAVGVGAGAGKDLLRRIANRGRGRFYYSHDGTDVPRIFSRETREVTKNAIVERALFPRVAKNVQALRGIDFARAPGLRGIVPVNAKRQTEILLRTHLGDPLLVRGRRGLGQTAAFASDAKARWAARWLTWNGFAKLWSQIARDTMRQGATMLGGASIDITPGADPGEWRVVVDVDSPQGFANELVGEIEILDPSLPEDDPGYVRTVPLALSAPGRYEASVQEVASGQRLIKAKLFDDGQDPPRLAAEAVSSVSVPYPAELSPEHLTPRPLGELTPEVAAAGPIDDVLQAPGDSKGRTRIEPLWPWVLWGLVLPLFAIDILLRRITLSLSYGKG